MNVLAVYPINGERVEIEETDGSITDYIRYSPDVWVWWIGESTESVWNCEELEESYQEFKNQAKNCS